MALLCCEGFQRGHTSPSRAKWTINRCFTFAIFFWQIASCEVQYPLGKEELPKGTRGFSTLVVRKNHYFLSFREQNPSKTRHKTLARALAHRSAIVCLKKTGEIALGIVSKHENISNKLQCPFGELLE